MPDPNIYLGIRNPSAVNLPDLAVDNTGGTDAGAEITSALTRFTSGQTAWLPAGTYNFATAPTNPNNADVVLAAGVVFTGAHANDARIMCAVAQGRHHGTAVLSAIGGGVDDWPSVIGAANALAAFGCSVTLSGTNGAFSVQTAVPMVSNVEIIGAPGISIVSTLPPVDGHSSTPFYASSTDGSVLKTALTANVVVGQPTLVVGSVAGLAIGNAIFVQAAGSDTIYASYTIKNIVGLTITVDRPVRKPFLIGAQVSLLPGGLIANININGNGMTLSGTGDRGIQIVCTRHCVVQNLNIASSFTSYIGSYDLAGVDNTFRNIVATVVANGPLGLAHEEAENGLIDGGSVTGASAGYHLNSCTTTNIRNVRAAESTATGLLISTEGTDVWGNRSVSVTGSTFTGGNAWGAEIEDGAVGVVIDDCEFSFNATDGLIATIQHGSNYPTDVTISNTRFEGNGNFGLNIVGGSGYKLINVLTLNNGVKGIELSAGGVATTELFAVNLTTDEPVNAFQLQHGGATLSIVNWIVRTSGSTGGAAVPMAVNAAGNDISVNGYNALFTNNHAATSILFAIAGASTLRVTGPQHFPGGGAGFAYAYKLSGGAFFFLDGPNDAVVVGSILQNLGGYANFGEVTLNGNTPVVVPLPGMGLYTGYGQIRLTLHTVGGTQGLPPSYTISDNVSFSVVGAALDTSTYHWKWETFF